MLSAELATVISSLGLHAQTDARVKIVSAHSIQPVELHVDPKGQVMVDQPGDDQFAAAVHDAVDSAFVAGTGIQDTVALVGDLPIGENHMPAVLIADDSPALDQRRHHRPPAIG